MSVVEEIKLMRLKLTWGAQVLSELGEQIKKAVVHLHNGIKKKEISPFATVNNIAKGGPGDHYAK